MNRHQTESFEENERSEYAARWYVRHGSGVPLSLVECQEWEDWCSDPDNIAEYNQLVRLGTEARRIPRPMLPTDEEIRQNRRITPPAPLTSVWEKVLRPIRGQMHMVMDGAVFIALLTSVMAFDRPSEEPSRVSVEITKRFDAVPFSELTLEALRAAGRPVLVNLGADWCSTCVANERNTLSRESVRQTMERKQVAYLKGEWSSRDTTVLTFVQRYGRDGVPLYLLFIPGHNEPEILPQILTEDIMLNVLSRVPDQIQPAT